MSDSRTTGQDSGADGRSILAAVSWRAVAGDLLLVIAWVGVVWVAWGGLGWPNWAYYVVVFGGILAYSLSGDPWAPSDGGSD